MDSRSQLIAVSEAIAAAIAARDVAALSRLLTADFVHRTIGQPPQAAGAFLDAIGSIPGEIVFVRLGGVEVDETGAGAIVTGVQHAQLRIDGQVMNDRRPFVDVFVHVDGDWRLRLAISPPAAEP